MSMATEFSAFCAKIDAWVAGGLELKSEADIIAQQFFGAVTATTKATRAPRAVAAPPAAGTERRRGRPPKAAATAPAAPVKLTAKDIPGWLAAKYPDGLPEQQLMAETGLTPLNLANFKRMIAKSGAVVVENGIYRCPPAPRRQAAA